MTSLFVSDLVKQALFEDLSQGDVTTDNLVSLNQPDAQTVAHVVVRQNCTVSGLDMACEVFKTVDSELVLEPKVSNGDTIPCGTTLLVVQGLTASVLKAERVALNFLQHLSGIATETRCYTEAIRKTGAQAKVTDTRKTTPGLRAVEKQAVIDGGGSPHRFNLGSSVMLKDNHIKAVGSITQAVSELRNRVSHTTTIEVETDTLAQVTEAVASGADIILLDNMSPETIEEALAIIDGKAITEASGGISLESIQAIAQTGVDFISTSKITLGARVIDIGLDFV